MWRLKDKEKLTLHVTLHAEEKNREGICPANGHFGHFKRHVWKQPSFAQEMVVMVLVPANHLFHSCRKSSLSLRGRQVSHISCIAVGRAGSSGGMGLLSPITLFISWTEPHSLHSKAVASLVVQGGKFQQRASATSQGHTVHRQLKFPMSCYHCRPTCIYILNSELSSVWWWQTRSV